MTTALVEKVRWPIDSAGSLMLQFDKYGFVRRFSEVDAAIKALFAAGEQGVWYDPSDIAKATIDTASVSAAISRAVVNIEPERTLFKTTLVDGMPLGDVNGSGTVTGSDSLAYLEYTQGTASLSNLLYIENVMHPYMVRNATTYAAYLTYSGGTLFQDAAGTTPVTAVEQPVGLMLDKSKNGVGTNGAKRVNLLTKTEDFTGWGLANSTSTTDTITSNGVASVHGAYQVISAANSTYVFSAEAKPNGTNFVTLACHTGLIQQYCSATFDVSAGVGQMTKSAVGSGAGAIVSTSCVASSDGYYKCTMVFTLTAVVANIYLATNATPTLDDYGRQIFTQSGLSAYVRKADLRLASEASTLPTYQKITDTWYNTLPGNHATQTTSTSRPVLSARVNLLTKTEDFGAAVWTKVANGTGSAPAVTPNAGLAPNGTNTADRIVFSKGAGTTTADYSLVGQSNINVGSGGTGSVYLKSNTGLPQTVMMYTVESVSVAVATITVGNEWVKLSSTLSTAITTGGIYIGTRGGAEFGGDSGPDVLVWGASLVPANQASLPYQRVNTTTDYDTAGFPHYLRFDGVDDFLVTPTITPGTDKVQVFAGVRKLSDATLMVFWEHGNNQAGGFTQGNYNDLGEILDRYNFWSRGSITLGFAWSGGYPAPTTNVLTGIGDISGDSAILRVNGTQAASSTADQGTGNFGNYPLYIGARAGTTFPFNGHLYSLIVRFAQSTDQQIIDAEKYVNDKTRAY